MSSISGFDSEKLFNYFSSPNSFKLGNDVFLVFIYSGEGKSN